MSWALVVAGAVVAGVGTAVGMGTAAMSRLELTRWVSQQLRGAGVAGTLLGASGRILGTASAAATVGTLVAAVGIAAALNQLVPVAFGVTVVLVAVPAFAVITYALPRAVASRWPEPIVRTAVPWVDRLARWLSPLLPPAADTPRAELATVMRSGGGPDVFERDELTVLSGLFAFTERPVREIMTARTDMVAVPEGAPVTEVARRFAESGYSRLPVYRDSLDNITGFYYVFDLLGVRPGGELRLRPVSAVPDSKRCADLLFETQRARRHMAVVLDEFGGTAGLVTFEDLLEALVAEIFPGVKGWSTDPAGIAALLEVDGAFAASRLAERLGITLPAGADTVGGMLARLAGRIPRAGERFVLKNLEFDVLAATPTRVERVVVRRGPVHARTLGTEAP
ncbi:MAG TPA: hemolysin family protein [Gemmatimonadales bacterium]